MNVLTKTLRSWWIHEPFTQGAAAAYYAIFSLPGLLILIIMTGALFFDQQRIEEALLIEMKNNLGNEVAGSVEKIISEARFRNDGYLTMAASAATLLFGSTALFAQLQRSLNHIWQVEVKRSVGLARFLKARVTALGVIIAIAFLMLVSLIVTAALSIVNVWLIARLPDFMSYGFYGLKFLVSFSLIAALFTLMFRILPDARVGLKYSFWGGSLSALLFMIGQEALRFYFDALQPQSTFGAAGSIILIMLWVSYSCLILLLGAEFANVAEQEEKGRKARPTPIARKKQNPREAA